MKKIAIIGECMIELNGQPFGSMQQTYGGDTLNAAVYLARAAKQQPVAIHYVSALGDDALSEGMRKRWQQEGINTEWVLRDSTRSPGLYMIQLDEHGERSFLYWREQSAAKYLLQHSEFAAVAEALRSMDVLFVSCISLAILEPGDRQHLLGLLQTLADAGVEIAFDSNYRPRLWPQDQGQTVRQVYQQMAERCDLALVTFDDEQALWGDSDYQQTLARYQRSGCGKVVVKLGAEGCVYQDFASMTQAELVPTQAVQQVVDTTSAGDSFNGGFLAAYLSGASLSQACKQGNGLAGLVIQHRGAIVAKDLTRSYFNSINKDY
ncbi:sugar kinase [Agarivorans gilvus]|nr:sugar kinase [Agarivorans gilvus]